MARPDRQHLLLAAGEGAGRLVAPLPRIGNSSYAAVQVLADAAASLRV
jgi:hypothetical protein